MSSKSKRRSGDRVEARVARLHALRQVKGKGPVGRFVAALRDPDYAVAKTAAMGLCDRKAIVPPLRELLSDPDPAMRWRAAALAWAFLIREFVPDLIRALRDRDRMVRAEAAWALRCADTDAAVRALLRATKDPDRMVAHYAAWTLRAVVKVKHPELRALKGVRLPALPLRPERRPRRRARAPAVGDNARAFEQFACQAKLPAYRAPLAAAPRTDGKRAACYAKAAAAGLVHIDGYPDAPLRKSDFRVVCSPEALHFHVRCRYVEKSELDASHRTYGSGVYADNSVEIFLDPTGAGGGRYFQICVNTRNARCDMLVGSPPGHTWRPGAGGETVAWRPRGVRSAVRVEKGHWDLELAVPFADLGLAAGKVNKLWRMNVVRNAHLPGLYENTSWCDLGDNDAHRPERFGYLWVDAGDVVNADAAIFEAVPLPLRPGLKGWTPLRGQFRAAAGEVAPVGPGGTLRWDRPIPFESFEVAAEVMIRHQMRLMFSPDAAGSELSFMVAYINLINEMNVAAMRHWVHWSPKYPGQLSIFKEVYPRLTHSRWYDVAVRVRPERLQCLLDGAVHMEMPTPRADVRHFGLGFVAGGRVRKLRVRPLA